MLESFVVFMFLQTSNFQIDVYFCFLTPNFRRAVYFVLLTIFYERNVYFLSSFICWWSLISTHDAYQDWNADGVAHDVAHGNVAVWGKIPGQRCDSTRAEIVAAIYSLSPDGPAHVGIDSMNTIRKFDEMIEKQHKSMKTNISIEISICMC